MADEEDKYIKQAENDQIARIRRERQLEALRNEERQGIASVLNTSDEIAAEALELGFDRQTARILHLVPVIQIAWADDNVQDSERKQILDMAAEAGIASGAALEYLELLLDQRPSDVYFERTNKVIKHLLETDAAEGDDILAHAHAVAGAAGGFFGFGTISSEEKELLAKLHELVGK